MFLYNAPTRRINLTFEVVIFCQRIGDAQSCMAFAPIVRLMCPLLKEQTCCGRFYAIRYLDESYLDDS